MLRRPAAAGLVILCQRSDRMGQLGEQRTVGNVGFVKTCREE
jgi:hypothetical protein